VSVSATSPRFDRVRVGVVGLGIVAQACHLPLLDRLGDRFDLTAVADLSPSLRAAIGQRYRVAADRRFATADDLLAAGGIDGLLILTSGSHADIARAAIGAGVPVFVEKPLAYTLAEMDELEATLAGANGRLELGYMKLYDPAVARALEAIERRRAEGGAPLRSIEVTVLHPPGEPQLAHARLLPPSSDVPPAVLDALGRETDALRQRAIGPLPGWVGRLYTDVLLGSVVHDLALVRAFAADPVAVDHVDAWSAGPWPPSVGIEGRLPDDARLSIRWHYLPGYAAYREGVRLVFEDASIELEFPAPYLLNAPTSIRIVERDQPNDRRDTSYVAYRESFEEELIGFHRLVVDGIPPRAGAAEGRADIVTCERVVRRLAEQLGLEVGGEAADLADAAAPGPPPAHPSWTTAPS
jgi:predicted dehydrogenase